MLAAKAGGSPAERLVKLERVSQLKRIRGVVI
jgi:hypothetical protein